MRTTRAEPEHTGPRPPPRWWLWVGVELVVVGLALAVWARTSMRAFADAENAAGHYHDVMELFRLTRGWLAAFWGGVLLAIAGVTLAGLWLVRARRAR